jgi:hypothetical protein
MEAIMDYLKKVHEAIKEFVDKYQNNPFNFLYEADIRSILFSIIFQKFGTETVKLRGGYSGNNYSRVDSIPTIPVKCEYPTPGSHESKIGTFDIAVIDPHHLIHYNSEQPKLKGWKSDPFWTQNLRIAIEIKYCQLGHVPRHKVTESAKDIEKLREYHRHSSDRKFLGIALIFIQSESIDIRPFRLGEALNDRYAEPSEGVYKYVITPSRWEMFSLTRA